MDNLLFEDEELDFLTYCSNVGYQDDLYRTFTKLCTLRLPARELPDSEEGVTVPSSKPSRGVYPTPSLDSLTTVLPPQTTHDPGQEPCSSGTLTRNLSSNIPDKVFSLKDKSLVKGQDPSAEALFLPRSRFLRKGSCPGDSLTSTRELRKTSCPTHGYYSIPNYLADTTPLLTNKEATERVTVQNIHSEAGILDLDDALSDVVADKDVLVAEFEEETPYTPAPPPDIRLIFNQVAGESSAAGSEKSTEPTKPQNINDSSYFSLSADREHMGWIDRWVQDADPSALSPASRSSPTPAERGIDTPAKRRIDTPAERRIDTPPERGIDTPAERRIDTPAERRIDTPAERRIDAPAERGLDSNVADERSIEGRISGTERGVDVPISFNEPPSTGSEEILKIEIEKDNLPLGCGVRHVDSRSPGLYIMSIDEASAAERDGRLKLGDKILDVNGVDLSAIPLVSVLDVYQEMTILAHVRLTVQRQTPGALSSPTGMSEKCPDNITGSSLKSRDSFDVTLNKGQKGLGFTIATREYNTCPGYSPLFVKTVHRHGAAAADGRMKPNDVILKVNGKSVVGKSQQEVVAMIRDLQGVVSMTLQRATSDLPAPEQQRSPVRDPTPPPPPPALHPTSTRTRLSLDIPLVAPDGKPVGLGISVKGKSMSIRGETRRDYGIFIKTILKGGAADLDGRLRADDQLLTADGQTLKGLSNKEAMQVLKQTLERAGKMSSLTIVVSRKDCLNLSADRRTAKPYSSFKDYNAAVAPSNSLSADPNKYRTLSLSSPNLGRKKKHHVEFDGNRGVAFSEDIQNIPQAGDVLESDEDVVFVGHLGEQLDPFNRDCIFRKSMKKIDHPPIHPNNTLRRASSHDSLSRLKREDVPPIIKKGVSQESVFSGKDVDPVYDTLTDDTLRPPRINDSLMSALQNGKISTSTEDPGTPVSISEEKPKTKTFLNFFSKKANKKKEDQKVAAEPVRQSEVPRSKGPTYSSSTTGGDWEVLPENRHHAPNNRSDRDFSTPSRGNVRGVEREQPRAPGSRSSMPESVNHKRSKSSDFYRDKELADRNGTGYIEHRMPHRDRDYMSRGPDRHSNRSNHSERSRGDRDRQPPYNHYPSREHPVRDPSQDHPVQDPSRDVPVRDPSRDHPVRETSRDPHSRDRRYMETVQQFRYGSRSPHHSPVPPPRHSPVPPPHYLDMYPRNSSPGQHRYTGSNTSLSKRQDSRPPHFQPILSQSGHPISQISQSHLQGRHNPEQLQGRHNPEQLSDV